MFVRCLDLVRNDIVLDGIEKSPHNSQDQTIKAENSPIYVESNTNASSNCTLKPVKRRTTAFETSLLLKSTLYKINVNFCRISDSIDTTDLFRVMTVEPMKICQRFKVNPESIQKNEEKAHENGVWGIGFAKKHAGIDGLLKYLSEKNAAGIVRANGYTINIMPGFVELSSLKDAQDIAKDDVALTIFAIGPPPKNLV